MNRRGFLSLLAKGMAALAVAPLIPTIAEPVNLSVPMTWIPASANISDPKFAMIKALLDNAIRTHDDLLEQAIFSEASNDIRGLQSGFEGTYHAASEAGNFSRGNYFRVR
jgi:hypothetical protein